MQEDRIRIENNTTYKWCNYGNHWIVLNEEMFYRNNSSRDGYSPNCKEHDKEKQRKYINENIEKHKMSCKEWYSKNQKHQNDNCKRWRKENLEYKKNYQLIYQKNNPEKIKEYNSRHRNHKISKNEWKFCCDVFEWKCAYCGKSIEEQYQQNNEQFHKDHVFHDGANDISNCVPACTQCNTTKWQRSIEYLLLNDLIIPEFNQGKYDKIILWITQGYLEATKPILMDAMNKG
jgi:hypothetical protein